MTMLAPTVGSSSSIGMNVVRLRNEGDTVFDKRYGPNARLTLQPGEELFVPEEIAWHFLGRWWTNNANPKYRERVEECRRLRVFYGAYEDDTAWTTNKPRLVAYTPEGIRITTVVDDPDGLESAPVSTPLGREQSLEAQIQFMQGQMAALQAQQEALLKRQGAENQPSPLADSPVPSTMPPAPLPPGIRPTHDFGAGGVPISNLGEIGPLEDSTVTGSRLPVNAETIALPDPGDISVDGPQRPPVGPRRIGHPEITG